MSQYVQYGAGLCGPENWTNFDISPTLRLQRLPLIGGIFNRLGPKFPRTVRYGDIIRGLPDLEQFIREYADSDEPDAALTFMTRTYLGQPNRKKGLSGLMRAWMGNAAHLWMWDYKAMSAELTKAGFVNIRRAQFGDSGDEMFEAVEDESRWGPNLGIDCNKPAG